MAKAANLASDLATLGATDQAIVLGTDTFRRICDRLGPHHPLAAMACANLAISHTAADQQTQARTYSVRAEGFYRRTLGLGHPDAQTFLQGSYLDCDFDPPPLL